MSPKLPALTGAELIAVLERNGWYVARVKGSHHVMRHAEIPNAIPVRVLAWQLSLTHLFPALCAACRIGGVGAAHACPYALALCASIQCA